MKILVIIGSLRKGNTYNTAKKIEKYHKTYSEVEYEYLFLKDIDLKLCKGCFVCISQGEHRCMLKDDRDLVIRKIENSDGVILASPNYVMSVPWLMKNFIDRFAFTMHRPKYFKQYFMTLVTSGSYMGTKQASKCLATMASGGKVVSKLTVLNSPGMNEKKSMKQEKRIEQKARKFHKHLSNKKDFRPSLGYLVWFSVFKAASNENREHSPADYNYYKDKDYFIDMNLRFFEKLLINLFVGFFSILIKKGFV